MDVPELHKLARFQVTRLVWQFPTHGMNDLRKKKGKKK